MHVGIYMQEYKKEVSEVDNFNFCFKLKQFWGSKDLRLQSYLGVVVLIWHMAAGISHYHEMAIHRPLWNELIISVYLQPDRCSHHKNLHYPLAFPWGWLRNKSPRVPLSASLISRCWFTGFGALRVGFFPESSVLRALNLLKTWKH